MGRAVELADVPGRLAADPVHRADEAAVGDGRGRLLQLPEILAQARDRGRGVHDVLGTGQRQRAPALRDVAVVADVDAEPAVGRVAPAPAGVARKVGSGIGPAGVCQYACLQVTTVSIK